MNQPECVILNAREGSPPKEGRRCFVTLNMTFFRLVCVRKPSFMCQNSGFCVPKTRVSCVKKATFVCQTQGFRGSESGILCVENPCFIANARHEASSLSNGSTPLLRQNDASSPSYTTTIRSVEPCLLPLLNTRQTTLGDAE